MKTPEVEHRAAGARFILPEGWPRPRGYSNAVVLPRGRALHIAGMIGWDAQERIVGPGFVEQFRQALLNIRACVEAAGSSVELIGSLTIYVADKAQYVAGIKQVGAAYREVFGRHYPAMTLVEVKSLLEAGAVVEIEARGVVPDAAP
jgi:enamine deaminase RidA (YjgF/YER057c/UK114 family)